MKNIHVLPTKKLSRLYTDRYGNYRLHNTLSTMPLDSVGSNQYIYITNYEEIKEGDCVISLVDEPFIFKCNEVKIKNYIGGEGGYTFKDKCKKIILTTDQDLIQDGVQAIDDEFLEWFVKNTSCEKVETVNVPYFDESGYSYLLIIPKEEPCDNCNNDVCCCIIKEEPKQETLEEVAAEFAKNHSIYPTAQDDTEYGFIEGAKWQQQQNKKLYSEEDMEQAFVQGALIDLFNMWNLSNEEIAKEKFKEWFNQNKKK